MLREKERAGNCDPLLSAVVTTSYVRGCSVTGDSFSIPSCTLSLCAPRAVWAVCLTAVIALPSSALLWSVSLSLRCDGPLASRCVICVASPSYAIFRSTVRLSGLKQQRVPQGFQKRNNRAPGFPSTLPSLKLNPILLLNI